jgi:hypothetical protein
MRRALAGSSIAGESHPDAVSDPHMSLSAYPAPISACFVTLCESGTETNSRLPALARALPMKIHSLGKWSANSMDRGITEVIGFSNRSGISCDTCLISIPEVWFCVVWIAFGYRQSAFMSSHLPEAKDFSKSEPASSEGASSWHRKFTQLS